MKISLITVCYNAEKTIEHTIRSVLAQDYVELEYIVIDGASRDRTMEIVSRYRDQIDFILSEPDAGMYDGINKGIQRATGAIVGILHADDVFADTTILGQIAAAFQASEALEALIGDITFINARGVPIRRYSAHRWHPKHFAWGFMPPHPSFYCKRDVFTRYGYYRTDFEIAADYELLIRFLQVHRISFAYLPLEMVRMRLGGKSTRGLRSVLKINQEIARACRMHHLSTNYWKLYSKYVVKVFEFVHI